MTRTSVPLLFALLAFATACGEDYPRSAPVVDCSVLDQFDFRNISDFNGGMTGWYYYADATPGGSPDPNAAETNVPPATLSAPGRCNDTGYLRLTAYGHNFWGAGFADWFHNDLPARADGTDYEGISFWARSPRNVEKTFLFNVDDSRTIVMAPENPALPDECVCADGDSGDAGDAGVPCEPNPDLCELRNEILRCLPNSIDQGGNLDLDGDGCIGPGDISGGANDPPTTRCRLPPSSDVGSANCYGGGVDAPPSGGARVPVANECGNQFHAWITTTETWQLFRIPFGELVQWPCPNRLQGGIDITGLAKFEITTKAGMAYDIWLDNLAFYRRR